MLSDVMTDPLILIVEDDESHAELIERSFADASTGYRLEIVTSFAMAERILTVREPDLILSDYRLPDAAGSDFVAISAGRWPVVVMTSQGNEELAVEVLRAGVHDYIVKSSESLAGMSYVVSRTLNAWKLFREKKIAEEAIRSAKRDWEQTFDAIPDLISIIDNNHTLIRVNKAMAERCGLPVQELIGRKCYETVHGVSKPPPCCPASSLFNDGMVHCHEVKEDRLQGVFDVTVSPLEDDENRIVSYVHVMRDITKRKRIEAEKLALEQQFQQAQKLESLGVLAGGIAHDFNNILAVILCNCAFIKSEPIRSPELIPAIETAAERAADLCRQMLVYAGKAQFQQRHIDLHALVSEMLKMLRSSVSSKVVFNVQLEPALPLIIGDASQLRQIVMNLIINAAEAIGAMQGEIKVGLTRVELDAGNKKLDYQGREIPLGAYLSLDVSDNGCGMDEKTQQRIFEPFYTTKFTGRGLGMSAVLGIISAHQGALQLKSHLGQGTNFTVFFPVSSVVDCEGQPSVCNFVDPQGGITILLAEDEDQLRFIATVLLEGLGYTVLSAANGQEALELYREYAKAINLVISDVDMPLMDGCELFNILKKIDKDLPIILSSGYGDLNGDERITAGKVSGFLSKPYKIEQLKHVLGECLKSEK